MSTSARLDVEELVIVPGTPAQCQVQLANRGSIVEAYTLTPVGDLAGYAVIEPATLSLYPDAEGTATITITVPREAVVEAGDVAFGVLVQPHEHPADTAVPEAVAHVQAFSDITAELTPRTSHGSRIGRHTLAIDNRGNRPVTVELTGKDPDAVMEFRFSPSTVEIAPGTAAFSKIKARPLERIWRGTSKTRQFSVIVTQVITGGPNGTKAVLTSVDGMMVQDPILPAWTGKAIAGGLAAAALLVGLWFVALRPAIDSSAENAVEKPLKQMQQKVDEAKTEAGAAQQAANTAQNSAKNTAKGQTEQEKNMSDREKELAAQAAAMVGTPFSQRWPLKAKPGKSVEESFEVPKDKVLRITDVNFESQGSTGWLDLRKGKNSLGGVAPQYFRNIQDYRYISPLAVLEAGEKVVVSLDCTTPAPGATDCENAVMVGGILTDKPPAPTTPPTSAAPN
ncbi:hypothetical protein [Kribbella sp. NPDC051718]|uniref:COG1470 family protein n=1 Tax=Kribbella sp. NPDC051718 TaxID=3155168 RepID=UPI003417F14E